MKVFLLAALVMLCSVLVLAQQPAPTPGYTGDKFFGTLTSANDDTGEIVLTADVNGKPETFTGVMKNFKITLPDGSKKALKPSDLPPQSKLVVSFKEKKYEEGPRKGEKYREVKDVEMAQ